jgi:hypothetical protein
MTLNASGAAAHQFYIANAEAMRIDSSGNVGIGTSSPTSTLTVNGTTTFQNSGTSRGFIDYDSGDGVFRIATTSGAVGGIDIAINGSGLGRNIKIGPTTTTFYTSVGIGTSSPAAALDVSGTARATQGMPIITEAGTAKTLALTDNGGYVRTTSGSAVTITVPLNSSVAFPTGAEIVVFQDGAGLVTFAATGGVTIKSKDSNLSLGGQYSAATLKKVATDTWDLIGDLA